MGIENIAIERGDTMHSIRFRATKNNPAKFYQKMVYDKSKSLVAGRPIFKPVLFLKTITGDKDVKDIRANDKHKQIFKPAWDYYRKMVNPYIETDSGENYTEEELFNKFPEIYKEYKSKLQEEGIEGTLLTEWGGIPLSEATELKYRGVFTVEQLSELEPGLVTPEKVLLAKAFIKNRKVEGAIAYQMDVIEQLKKKNEELRGMLNERKADN